MLATTRILDLSPAKVAQSIASVSAALGDKVHAILDKHQDYGPDPTFKIFEQFSFALVLKRLAEWSNELGVFYVKL